MPVEYLKETPSQTAGPYVHIGTLPANAGLPIRQNETLNVVEAPGEKIVVEGIVLDGSGAPVKDAMLELYQATGRLSSTNSCQTDGSLDDRTVGYRPSVISALPRDPRRPPPAPPTFC
jgi:protocatechuate 3,4-dioxygenase beta subunit